MKILVCNVGSTSLKFKLYDMPACTVLSQGKAERVGSLDDANFFQYGKTCETGSLVNEAKSSHSRLQSRYPALSRLSDGPANRRTLFCQPDRAGGL